MSEPLRPEVRVFNAALELPSEAERAAYLAQTCAGDEDLRRKVEALLRAHAGAEEFFRAVEPGLGPSGNMRVPCPVTEKPGDRIGRYKLLEKIGEGGCGVVYLAEQEEPVKRRVALKVIRPGMDSQQVLARFAAERQALALMDHPHIAKVLDAGATDQGRPFFVMELVHGIKITDYCDQNNLSTEQRLALFIQACHAVQHAHQKGIIHRDLKPSNILVTVQDGQPVAKVIDFGIAKATAGQILADKTVHTAFEQFIGTPAYMSPEQAEMSALDIDTRSDIYSLGVLLYELLTGKTPFDPKRLVEAGLEEIRRIIREEEPPRPSTRLSALAAEEQTTTAKRRSTDAPQLIHQVRGDLDWIAMKALDKDRTRRYATANALASDIERHLNDEPVEAHAPSRLYRLRKLVRRHKLAFAAVGFMFAVLAIGLGVSFWSLHQAKREASRSQQVARFLQDMLQGVGPSVARGRNTAMLREILDKTAQRLDKELKNQPDVEADLRTTIGTVYFELGHYTNAEAMHRQALALQEKLRGSQNLQVACSLNNLAVALKGEGRFEEAEALHRQALGLRKKLLGSEHPDVAISLDGLANVLSSELKLAESETLYREALAMQRKLLGSEHPDVAISLDGLTFLLCMQGKLAEAEALCREALALRKKLLGSEHPNMATSLEGLALVLQSEGKLAEAEALCREALALRKKLLGSEHPNVAHSLERLASVLQSEGKLAEAETLYREELALRRKLLGGEQPYAVGLLGGLASLLRQEGEFVELETLSREELAMIRKRLGNEHPYVASSLANLAGVLRHQGKLAEAETLCREALALQKKLLGSEHPDVAISLDDLASVLVSEHKLAEAETLYRESLAMRKKLLGNEHLPVASSLNGLANVLASERKLAESETLYREELAIDRKQMGSEHPFLAVVLNRLVDVLMRDRKFAEAEKVLDDFLTPSAASQPKSAGLLRSRGNLRARTGHWKEAAADFSRVIEFEPENHDAYHSLAPLLVQSGDLEGYRRHCARVVARFGGTNDPVIAERMAKDCMILPASGVDLTIESHWAETAVTVGKNHKYLAYFQGTKGLAEYRQGRLLEAAEWSRKAIDNKSYPHGTRYLEDYMVLAMTKYQMHQRGEARAALAKGLEIEEKELPHLDSGDLGAEWLDWIIAHALMSEAKALIGTHPATVEQESK